MSNTNPFLAGGFSTLPKNFNFDADGKPDNANKPVKVYRCLCGKMRMTCTIREGKPSKQEPYLFKKGLKMDILTVRQLKGEEFCFDCDLVTHKTKKS